MYIKPRIVLLDETEYWAKHITEEAGKIHGAYIYDENMRVHCCEFTPSYFLEPLYAYSIIKQEQGLKGCKQSVYDQYLQILRNKGLVTQ